MYVLKLQDRVEGWWNTSRPVSLGQAWRAYRAWLADTRANRATGFRIERVESTMCGLLGGRSIFEDAEI